MTDFPLISLFLGTGVSMDKGWIKYLLLIAAVLLIGAGLDTDRNLSYVYIKGPAWQQNYYTVPEEHKVNINTATAEELSELDGIGEALAERIVEYRKTAPFTDISELKNVKGIGDAKFNAIKDKIEI